MSSAQSKGGGGNNNRGDITSISPLVPDNTKRHSIEWYVTQHETLMGLTLCTTLDTLRLHKQQQKQDICDNKGQTFTVDTSVFAGNFRLGQPNWAPGTISKRKRKLVQVGKQLLARYKNQLRSRYTKNNIIDKMPTIPLDLLMDTFDLSSPSPPLPTNANGTGAGLYRKWPKRNCTKVQYEN